MSLMALWLFNALDPTARFCYRSKMMCRIVVSALLSFLILAGGVCALPLECPMLNAEALDNGHAGCHETPSQVLKACCCDEELVAHVAPSVTNGRTLDPPMPASEPSPLSVSTGQASATVVADVPPPPDPKRLSRLSILLI